MTKDEFKILVKGMKAVYTQPTFIPDNDAFNVWYELLKDVDYKTCAVAIQTYMSTEKFPPTIADIREKVFTNANVNQLGEAEAWDMVRKAISDSSYHSEERFSEFPDDVKRAVGSPSQLRIWATDTEFNDSVVQSQFLRSYRERCKKSEEFARLPANVQALITSTTVKMIGEQNNE